MTQHNKYFSQKKVIYISAFLLPALIFSIVLIFKNITPFGNNTLLTADMEYQYIPFYSELLQKLKSGGSFFYSWKRGMGYNFLGEAGYYMISPLNILLVFFTNKTIPIAMSLLLILKCGFAGLNMCIYLIWNAKKRKISLEEINTITLILISTCYALSSYMLNYYFNIIWIDCLVLFPLVILSLERLFIGKRPYLFSIYLGLSILSNYYIGYMICLFCVIYFIYLFFSAPSDNRLHSIIRFIIYSLIAGMLNAVILLQAVLSVNSSSSGNLHFYDSIFTYYPAPVTLLRFCMDAMPTFWHHPYLYSSIAAFVLVPVYIADKNIPLKERIGKCCIISFMLISFQLNILDYIWNGFHLVQCFAGRQSFVVIFLILTMCAESLVSKTTIKKKFLLLCYISYLLIFFYINIYFNDSSTYVCIIKNIILLTMYLALIFKKESAKHFTLIFSLMLFAEISLNTYNKISPGINYSDYTSNIASTEESLSYIKDSSFYRIKNDTKMCKNDGSLCNYNTAATYSSLANDDLSSFLVKLGFHTSINAFNDISSEPILNNILCEKYIISNNRNLTPKSLSQINKSHNSYIYQNEDALSIAFEVPVIDNKLSLFNGNTPFDRLNSFAKSVGNCKKIYQKLDLSTKNGIMNIPAGLDVYLYSRNELQSVEFNSVHKESLYSDNLCGIGFSKIDNYIYHINNSIYGGTLTLPKNVKDINAYSFNYAEYEILMNTLSANQMTVSSFSDSKIEGTINAQYNGLVMTSIPYNEGWTVKIDNKKVKTSSIENALLAFQITKGYHSITFSYIPKGFLLGSIISCISLFVLILLMIIHLHRLHTAISPSISQNRQPFHSQCDML